MKSGILMNFLEFYFSLLSKFANVFGQTYANLEDR